MMVGTDIRVVSTIQLLELMDLCEMHEMQAQVPESVVRQLDACGRHVLQAHSGMDDGGDIVHAFAMLKELDRKDPSTSYVVDVPMQVWSSLPVYVHDDD